MTEMMVDGIATGTLEGEEKTDVIGITTTDDTLLDEATKGTMTEIEITVDDVPTRIVQVLHPPDPNKTQPRVSLSFLMTTSSPAQQLIFYFLTGRHYSGICNSPATSQGRYTRCRR